ncbi:hypothetical protein OFY73_004784 [Salmonella enterica]|nr:hypothetical protein [Salmonella enterica]EJB9142986.1 hypothetical protein [Salmonella enterica]EJB9345681.1 hypothetical protein [Salmonella enterica]EJC0002900.1 hypothetical protein [Salmonella enterica]EJC0484967.1 hypothetical protein [Salmonella enterica]
MNFSEEKSKDFPKKVQTSLFDVDCKDGKTFISALKDCANFQQNGDFSYSDDTRVRIKNLVVNDDQIFAGVTLYEPKALVPVTPKDAEHDDLQDIENYDKCHIFLLATNSNILTIFQLSGAQPLAKLKRLLKLLNIDANVSEKLNKDAIGKIIKDGIRSISLTIETTKEELEQAKAASLGFGGKAKDALSKLFEKEQDDDDAFYGLLTLDKKHNPKLLSVANKNPSLIINDLSEEFFITTSKGQTIKSSEIRTKKDYYTKKYGSTTIKSDHAKEILEHFKGYIL